MCGISARGFQKGQTAKPGNLKSVCSGSLLEIWTYYDMKKIQRNYGGFSTFKLASFVSIAMLQCVLYASYLHDTSLQYIFPTSVPFQQDSTPELSRTPSEQRTVL